MTYTESKKKIEEVRQTNEAAFRMAISHLVDVGIRHLTEDNIERTCSQIMQEDDSKTLLTNEFKCELIRMAGELAHIDHIHLLVYISREMYFGVDDNHISYKRAIQMIKQCINWITSEVTLYDAYNDLTSGIGFSEEELEELGYAYLLDVAEEE